MKMTANTNLGRRLMGSGGDRASDPQKDKEGTGGGRGADPNKEVDEEVDPNDPTKQRTGQPSKTKKGTGTGDGRPADPGKGQ